MPVYSQIDPQQEERDFAEWESLYAVVYPQDWYESNYCFNNRIKQLYENRHK